MKVKESKELDVLATQSGKTAKQVSDIIISELIKRQIIEDIPDNWRCTIADCIEPGITIEDIVNVIRMLGISIVKSLHFDALAACILIGDGDCLECGGELEITDGQYRCVGGDGYMTPYEYTPIWEEKTCLHCGHKTEY